MGQKMGEGIPYESYQAPARGLPEKMPDSREGYMAGDKGLPLRESGADDRRIEVFHVLDVMFLRPGLPEQVIDGFSPGFGDMKEKDFFE